MLNTGYVPQSINAWKLVSIFKKVSQPKNNLWSSVYPTGAAYLRVIKPVFDDTAVDGRLD